MIISHSDRNELNDLAIEKYTKEADFNKLCEEMMDLWAEVRQTFVDKSPKQIELVADEIADVLIMIDRFIERLQIPSKMINDSISVKIKRQIERLKNGKEV